jgi:hypothetical protein
MKKHSISLVLATGLTLFAGSAKCQYTVEVNPLDNISKAYISAWNLNNGTASFLYGASFASFQANNNTQVSIILPNGTPTPKGFIFAGVAVDNQNIFHVTLSSSSPFPNDIWSNIFTYFPNEDSIKNDILGQSSSQLMELKSFEMAYSNKLFCALIGNPPNVDAQLTEFSSAVAGGTFKVSYQSVPEPSTYALFGIGAIGMLIVLRRKKTA